MAPEEISLRLFGYFLTVHAVFLDTSWPNRS